MTRELQAREWKATAIEQALVEMGHQEVPDNVALQQEAVTKAGYKGASQKTWDLVATFLADRFGSRS